MALLDSILFNLLNLASGFLFTTLQAVYNIIDGDLYIEGNNIRLQPSKLMRYFQSLLSSPHHILFLTCSPSGWQSYSLALPLSPFSPFPLFPLFSLFSLYLVFKVFSVCQPGRLTDYWGGGGGRGGPGRAREAGPGQHSDTSYLPTNLHHLQLTT